MKPMKTNIRAFRGIWCWYVWDSTSGVLSCLDCSLKRYSNGDTGAAACGLIWSSMSLKSEAETEANCRMKTATSTDLRTEGLIFVRILVIINYNFKFENILIKRVPF